MSNFSKTVERFAKNFGIDALTVIQKTAFDISGGLIEGTPRDTGRAAASWNVTKDKIDFSVAEKGNYSKNETILNLRAPEITALDRNSNLTVFYISNNLSYIVPLARGHSGQAPTGWVERVISNYENYLDKNSRGL